MAWLDADTALFAGWDGSTASLWRTRDHGASWEPTPAGFGRIDDIAVEGQDVWMTRACSDGSLTPCDRGIQLSSDAGLTWESVATIGSPPLAWLSFGDVRHGFGVITRPPDDSPRALFRTSDGGRTWQRLPAPCGATGEPVAVSFATADHGWLACDEDLGAGSAVKGIFETTDGGDHWAVRSSVVLPGEGQDIGSISGGGYLHGLRMTAGGRGLTWYGRGGAARTIDSGVTWVDTAETNMDVIIPFAGWTLDEAHWYLLATDADLNGATFLQETLDGGASWTRTLVLP
jgi:hypothetical protein